MRKLLPWYLKITAKIILSRIPIPYRAWSRLGLFKLGKMTNPDYALKVFFIHYDSVSSKRDLKGKTFLEMGPGDSVASALSAAAVGAQKIYLVDVGNFASRDLDFYRAVAKALKARGLQPPDIAPGMGFEDLLKACNAEYLTGGLDSLAQIPDAAVDYAWSHSVVEHIRKGEFPQTAAHHYRIMKPGGVISHSVDLQDHLGGGLNNLRFSEKSWEGDFMALSGFYTNRLRASEILKLFEDAGFAIREKRAGRWDAIPLPREKMAAPFKNASDDDLLTRTLYVQLEK